jgi:hypothetical protein
MISQGAIRDFNNVDFCKIKWNEIYKNGFRIPPTDAMINGLVFEQKVIGASRGGEIHEIPKLKNGKESKREIDLNNLVVFAKQTIKKLKIKFLEIQPEWKVGDLSGHPDALIEWKGSKAIMDLKFTGTKEDDSCRWNPYAWGRDYQYKDFSQAIHYVEMYYLMTGEYLPFFYLVFGKSGWVRFLSVDISALSLEHHREKIKNLREELKDFKPYPTSRYQECVKCPIQCAERVKKPNCITVNV